VTKPAVTLRAWHVARHSPSRCSLLHGACHSPTARWEEAAGRKRTAWDLPSGCNIFGFGLPQTAFSVTGTSSHGHHSVPVTRLTAYLALKHYTSPLAGAYRGCGARCTVAITNTRLCIRRSWYEHHILYFPRARRSCCRRGLGTIFHQTIKRAGCSPYHRLGTPHCPPHSHTPSSPHCPYLTHTFCAPLDLACLRG